MRKYFVHQIAFIVKERWGNVEEEGMKLNNDTLNMYDERGQ